MKLNTLNSKTILFLVLILGASLSVTTFFAVEKEKTESLQSAREKVESLAEIVQSHMLLDMKEGRCKDMKAFIRSLSAKREFMVVRLSDGEGRVIDSTDEKERGENFPVPDASILSFKGTHLIASESGERTFSALRPLFNESECAGCHDKTDKPLAYLDVRFSLASVDARLRSYRNNQILSAFGILVMMCGAMFLFFSRVIKKRILELSHRMTQIDLGNFEVRLNGGTHRDEIDNLIGTFNVMVANLQEMRRREEEQKRLLKESNEELEEKVGELNTLYESAKAISRSIHLDDVLRGAIENVTRSLGFDRVVMAVFDETGKTLVGKWSIGIDEEIVRNVRIPREELKGVLREIVTKEEPVIVKVTSDFLAGEGREIRNCWDVMQCGEETCPAFGNASLRCWMTTDVRCCISMREGSFDERLRVCSGCRYFNEEVVKRSDVVQLLLFGSYSFVAAPLKSREHVLGVLLADKLHSEPKDISDADIKLLMTFLSHVSSAIENALLYRKLEEKVDLSQRELARTNEELKQNVTALDEIRSFNESILQNVYAGIVTYTREGAITFINKPASELLGWGESEAVGKPLGELIGDCREGAAISYYPDAEENSGFAGETEIVTKGGEMIPVEIFLSHLRDRDGKITGITGIFRDIRMKREMEMRMKRMDKLATLGELASGIVHEVKNPLACISSAIQVLFTSLRADARKREAMDEVLRQIRRLSDITTNLLTFAKPGRLRLLSTDPEEVVRAVVFLIDQKAKEQRVEICLDMRGEVPRMMTAPHQMQQAILNVALNGIQAMGGGGVLTITLRKKADPLIKGKSFLSVIITDTGPGIPDDIKGRIFNPFFTTKAEGTGLGLSITQRIVDQLGGKMELKSAQGKGAAFIIDFPMEQGHVE
jgi:PAS domain S-box-containing protein